MTNFSFLGLWDCVRFRPRVHRRRKQLSCSQRYTCRDSVIVGLNPEDARHALRFPEVRAVVLDAEPLLDQTVGSWNKIQVCSPWVSQNLIRTNRGYQQLEMCPAQEPIAEIEPSIWAQTNQSVAWIQEVMHLAGADAREGFLSIRRGTSCPRLHYDKVALRCLVTLQGPGTWVIPEESVNRAALMELAESGDLSKLANLSPEDIDRLVLRASGHVQVPQGRAVLLKGSDFAQDKSQAAIHRSPRVPETMWRVLLQIDGALQS